MKTLYTLAGKSKKTAQRLGAILAILLLPGTFQTLSTHCLFAQENPTTSAIFQVPSGKQAARENRERESNEKGLATMLIRGLVVDEQGAPVPGATITTLPMYDQPIHSTISKSNGAFLLRFPAEGFVAESFMVQDVKGARASFVNRVNYTTDREEAFKIIVRPWRFTKVRVVNAANQPIESASVSMVAAPFEEICVGETDSMGQVTLRFPADAKVNWIVGFKDGEGLDYYENYQDPRMTERLQVPDEIDLKLDGAVTVSVTALDSARRPVANVPIGHSAIYRGDKLNGIRIAGRAWKADENGRYEFKWIPKNPKRSVQFFFHDPKYFILENPKYDPRLPARRDLTATLYKVGTIRGRVVHTDESPAVGIRIKGEGRSATSHHFRGETSTRADGTYEINEYPDQTTILAIADDELAAPSVLDLWLREGEVKENVNFRLGAGTLLTGTIPKGPDKQSARRQIATLVQKGNGKAELVRWFEIDSYGRYRFRVGPGNYWLLLPDAKTISLAIRDEQELVIDDHMVEPIVRSPISGLVLDHESMPITGAELMGESASEGGQRSFRATSDANGKYTSERWNYDLSVYAFHSKLGLAGYQVVPIDQPAANIILSPAASISSSVVDSNGKPMANETIYLVIHPPTPGAVATRSTTTNERGQFEFAAVQIGLNLTLELPRAKTIPLKVIELKRYELPAITINGTEQ